MPVLAVVHSTRYYARLVITTPASENQARACTWQTVKQQVRRADTYSSSASLHRQQPHFFQRHVIQLTAIALHRQNLYSLTDGSSGRQSGSRPV